MDASLEKLADYLDTLEKSDPETYKALLSSCMTSSEGMADVQKDPAALMDLIKQSQKDTKSGSFTPQFPGSKVLKENSLQERQEGIYIDVSPGFVMKTRDLSTNTKIFVNFCHSQSIQSFSKQKRLNKEGEEQEGMHVPLSLGSPHSVCDKKGESAIAYDIGVNTKVIEDCKEDTHGISRNFVCELAIDYIEQKHDCKLDYRYKLPRLTYQGPLPPPKHYIRKQAPKIEEVSDSEQKKTLRSKAKTEQLQRAEKQLEMQYEIAVQREDGVSKKCMEIAAANGGHPLDPEMLHQLANCHLIVKVIFDTRAQMLGNSIVIQLQPELLSIHASDHKDLQLYLAFPVHAADAQAVYNETAHMLTITMRINSFWDPDVPDIGSAPWLLKQALGNESDDEDVRIPADRAMTPASIIEMFHLEKNNLEYKGGMPTTHRPKDVESMPEDEELPEDKFHKKDIMSLHILEQRKSEQKARQTESKAKHEREKKQVEEKRAKAAAAGKTWQEMYPNEHETTYLDVQDLLSEKKCSISEGNEHQDTVKEVYVTSQEAEKAAALWLEQKNTQQIPLVSAAMGFELL